MTTADPCAVHAPNGHLAPALSHSRNATEVAVAMEQKWLLTSGTGGVQVAVDRRVALTAW